MVEFRKAESQNQWEKFLADICKALKIDFIYSILDRIDKAPVWRSAILSLLRVDIYKLTITAGFLRCAMEENILFDKGRVPPS